MLVQALMFCHDRVSTGDFFLPRRNFPRVKQDPVDLILSASVLNFQSNTFSPDTSQPLSRDVPSTRKEDATIVFLQRTGRPLVRMERGKERGREEGRKRGRPLVRGRKKEREGREAFGEKGERKKERAGKGGRPFVRMERGRRRGEGREGGRPLVRMERGRRRGEGREGGLW